MKRTGSTGFTSTTLTFAIAIALIVTTLSLIFHLKAESDSQSVIGSSFSATLADASTGRVQGASTGAIVYDAATGLISVDKDAGGFSLMRVNDVASFTGSWQIMEDGTIVAKQLCLEDVCVTKDELKKLLELIE